MSSENKPPLKYSNFLRRTTDVAVGRFSCECGRPGRGVVCHPMPCALSAAWASLTSPNFHKKPINGNTLTADLSYETEKEVLAVRPALGGDRICPNTLAGTEEVLH